MPAATETYVAYGACEILVKECARQADYEVPQRNLKDVPIPRTDDGQDLGVGKGWWYESQCLTFDSHSSGRVLGRKTNKQL